jgi:hypothetical protein
MLYKKIELFLWISKLFKSYFFTVFVKLLIGILITDKKLYRSVETEYAKSSKSQKNKLKKKDIS